MTENLKNVFEKWGQTAKPAYAHHQWQLSKWEVVEGIIWPEEKISIMIQSIVEGLDLKSHHRWVDLGCAGGWIRQRLSQVAPQGYGLDFSESMLAQARLTEQKAETSTYICGAIGCLPIHDESLDRALSYFVFLNFMDDRFVEKALVDVYRILKKGGRALIGQLPDRSRSQDYDREKSAYLKYCHEHFQLGESHREVCQVSQKLFDLNTLKEILNRNEIYHEFRKTFNPFYRPGVEPLIDWRFDLVLKK